MTTKNTSQQQQIYFIILIVGILLFIAQPTEAALSDNVQGFYQHEDNAATTTVTDATGNYTGTSASNTNTMSTTGLINESFDFDGSTDEYTTSASLGNFGSGDFTISVWLKKGASDFQTGNIVHQYDVTSGQGLYLRTEDATGKIRFVLFADALASHTTTDTIMTNGSWSHVVALRNGSNIDVWIDNTKDGTTGSAGGDIDSTNLVHIGTQSHAPGVDYRGLMDELGFWNRALTPTEIGNLYNNGLNGTSYPWSGGGSPPVSSNFTITITNMNNFTATIDSTDYTTTNGTVYTHILDNSTSLWNIVIWNATNYFNKTYTNYNVSSDISTTLVKFPYLTVTETWDGTAISNYNVTVNGTTYSGQSNPFYIGLNGSYSTTVAHANYLSETTNIDWTPDGAETETLCAVKLAPTTNTVQNNASDQYPFNVTVNTTITSIPNATTYACAPKDTAVNLTWSKTGWYNKTNLNQTFTTVEIASYLFDDISDAWLKFYGATSNTDDTIIKEIIEGDLHTLWNLLQLHREEYPDTYKKVKYGVKLHFHIGYELHNQILDRSRAGEVVIAGNIYAQEDYWDEKIERETEARNTLRSHYMEEDEAFGGR